MTDIFHCNSFINKKKTTKLGQTIKKKKMKMTISEKKAKNNAASNWTEVLMIHRN